MPLRGIKMKEPSLHLYLAQNFVLTKIFQEFITGAFFRKTGTKNYLQFLCLSLSAFSKFLLRYIKT